MCHPSVSYLDCYTSGFLDLTAGCTSSRVGERAMASEIISMDRRVYCGISTRSSEPSLVN
jgi:hypothetical protein